VRYIAVFLLLSGCMVGPNYEVPENDVPDTWSQESCDDAVVTKWWELFNDRLLNQYIEEAVSYNRDVRAAEANVLQAIALRQVVASNLYPMVGADFNGARTYFSKNGPVFAIGPAAGSLPGTVSGATGLPFSLQVPQTQNLYNFLFDASWEIDLFGKTRRSIEAADAQIGGAIERKNDILLSIMAEVARNYMELRSAQLLAILTEKNIELLEKSGAIICESFQQGYVNRLIYERIEADLLSAKSKLPPLISSVHKSIYAISVLTGQLPENLLPELLPLSSLPKAPQGVSVGLRSDLLRRRPDIRRAERELAAATANIGVAVASFFPTITLFGDGGLQSLQFSKLFEAGSKTWALGGDAMTPVFQGGQLLGQLDANKAATKGALDSYEQTVLNALQETEKYLTTYNQDLKVVEELSERTKKYQILSSLSESRYQNGLINLLDQIDVERELILAEQSLLQSETTSLLDLISLYKALGGGWESE